MNEPGMVIVGAGHAGSAAAVSLRDGGYGGPITLVGSEAGLPYERPPLSKAVLVAETDGSGPLIVGEEGLLSRGIVHLAGIRASSIDRSSRTVRLADGRHLSYDRLLLATGAQPRRLGLEGSGASDVLYLRTFEDALAIRSRLRPASRLVVIGGGFIGLEIAASARERGCDVTIVEAGPRLLMRGVPAHIAQAVAERHRVAGVAIRCGTGIASLERREGALLATLSDGSEIACDGVIAGVGAIPVTELAEAGGLAVDNGIAVDAGLRTSDPAILAAGDCCSFPHPLYDGRRLRLEAWRNAQDQGAAAARAMAGEEIVYDAVPWFWSDQYDLTVQVAGLPDAGVSMVERDLGQGVGMTFHLAGDGRLVAASAFGPNGVLARDIRLAEMMIAKRLRPDPAALASAQTRLKSLLS